LPDEENTTADQASEEELEKPSFLRRLRGSRRSSGPATDTETPAETPKDDDDEPAYPFGNPDDYSDDSASPAKSDDDDAKPDDTEPDDQPAKADKPKKDGQSHHEDSDK